MLMLLQAVLYGIFPAVLLGAAGVWLRMQRVRKLSAQLLTVFDDRKLELMGADVPGAGTKEAGTSVVSMMGDLKSVYRFKDVRQVSLLCRCMRKWDEDGIPDAQAAEFGEFILKVGTAAEVAASLHQGQYWCFDSHAPVTCIQTPGNFQASNNTV